MTFSCGEEEITDAAGMRLRGGHLAPSFFFFVEIRQAGGNLEA